MIHQKQIEKFEHLPKREKVGFDRIIKSWYEEDFQKSANEYYGLGKIYFINCGNKHVGKPVQQLIHKLKSNSNYIHNKSFKKAVDDLIFTDLISRTHDPRIDGDYKNRNDWFYVDSNNLVQKKIDLVYFNIQKYSNCYVQSTEYMKEHYPQYVSIAKTLWNLHLIKTTDKVLEYYHSTFKYIVRYNGLHYYVSNEELDLYDIEYKYVPRLKASHQVVINNALNELQLLKLSVNDLKYHGLIDVKENIQHKINF